MFNAGNKFWAAHRADLTTPVQLLNVRDLPMGCHRTAMGFSAAPDVGRIVCNVTKTSAKTSFHPATCTPGFIFLALVNPYSAEVACYKGCAKSPGIQLSNKQSLAS
jgi:hypothetical protein